MVNPGSFSGSRKAFLDDQKELYARAVADNHVSDTVADIQRRYFKRYPISLPHDQEPSAEWLAQVDDKAIDPEIPPPEETLNWEEDYARYDAQMRGIKARKDVSTTSSYHKVKVHSHSICIANQEASTISIQQVSRRHQGFRTWRLGPFGRAQKQIDWKFSQEASHEDSI